MDERKMSIDNEEIKKRNIFEDMIKNFLKELDSLQNNEENSFKPNETLLDNENLSTKSQIRTSTILDVVLEKTEEYFKLKRIEEEESNSLNIFYSAYYSLYPLVYNTIINNSGAPLDPEYSEEINFHNLYLNTKNKLSVIFLFRKNLICFNLLIEFIYKFYYKAWRNYCTDVIKTLNDKSQLPIDIKELTIEDIFAYQKIFLKEENKKKYKFFFLNEFELNSRINNFSQNTLKNIKIIEYDTLHELNIKLLNIPILFKENFSNLGLVIMDSPNIVENLLINISDEKSIIFPINNNRKRLSFENNNTNNKFDSHLNDIKVIKENGNIKKKPGAPSEILTHIYQILYFYQKSSGFNLLNLIWDYERGLFFNQINYHRTKYENNFAAFENNNNLKAKFYYLNNSDYIVYKIPIKPLIGIQLIPVESIYSSDEPSGVFAIAYMESSISMKVDVFKMTMNCSIEQLKTFTENIIVKHPIHFLNNKDQSEDINETIDEPSFIISQNIPMD